MRFCLLEGVAQQPLLLGAGVLDHKA